MSMLAEAQRIIAEFQFSDDDIQMCIKQFIKEMSK